MPKDTETEAIAQAKVPYVNLTQEQARTLADAIGCFRVVDIPEEIDARAFYSAYRALKSKLVF